MNGKEAKDRFWAHWDDVLKLCGKRFLRDANLAEEASRYVLDKLEADDWRRVRAWEAQGNFKTFLTVVVNRLLSDFYRQRFGSQRPPKWLKEKIDKENDAIAQRRATHHPDSRPGSLWELAYNLLYRNKYSRQETIKRLLTQESSPAREQVEQIVTMILARCPAPIVSPDAPKQPLDELGDVKSEQFDPLENYLSEEKHGWEEWMASLLENGTPSAARPAREQLRRFQGSIHLTEEDRMLLRLRFEEGLAVPNIARMLGLQGDPYKRLGRILAAVRNALRSGAAKPNPPATLSETERRIAVWIGETEEPLATVLRVNQPYTLNVRVGQPVPGSLVDGPDSVIPAADIPEAGLETHWRIVSRTVEFAPRGAGTTISLQEHGNHPVWTAAFDLRIPQQGDSITFQLQITARATEQADLDIVVFARQEIYRQFTVNLTVCASSPTTEIPTQPPALINDDTCLSPAAQLNLPDIHEWTTPPGRLMIGVSGTTALVNGEAGSRNIDADVEWHGVPARVAGLIDNVRRSADAFRARRGTSDSDYLNAIDPDDLAVKLAQWSPPLDWLNASQADAAHQERWAEVCESPALRQLAHDGYRLYDGFFPAGSELRTWLDQCQPGHRLDIAWRHTHNPHWIPHVPWGLMYRQPLSTGQPVFAEAFWAQWFRIAYSPYRGVGRKDLGALNDTHRIHLLYWGEHPQDPTAIESHWQRQQWQVWDKQIFVPATLPDPEAKRALIQQLESPSPAPATVLYLFCQCGAEKGNDLLLRFANSRQATAVLDRTELGLTPLADHPLVFANACGTSEADPYQANELETIFFDRGCRAYLGTEIKVPIQLASRFASIFFHFFYRKLDPKPMAAGEAVAQTRQFLWRYYCNLGGIFYTYINQYELFMADDRELQALRHPTEED